jgi:hypothetical protein
MAGRTTGTVAQLDDGSLDSLSRALVYFEQSKF